MTSHALNTVPPARRLTQAIGAWVRGLVARSPATAPVEAPSAPPVPRTPAAPQTLDALGVPGVLAREFELYFDLMGHTDGDRIVGYTFTTPDGRQHDLCTSRLPAPLDRAA